MCQSFLASVPRRLPPMLRFQVYKYSEPCPKGPQHWKIPRLLIFTLTMMRKLSSDNILPYDVGFNPSTQRHYRRLIYYIYIATCFGRTTIIKLKNIL
jgi:hypothetical protein